MNQPPVAVSCGEPAGVGPEIIVKARAALGRDLPLFAIGDPRHFAGLGMAVVVIDDPLRAADVAPDSLPLLAHGFAAPARPGIPTAQNAQGVIDVIARGVDLVRTGAAAALCTAPIHKKALKDGAGFAYPGHTEYLAALSNTPRVVMMLACDALRVVPVTIHIPLAEVPAALTPELLSDTLRITHAAMIRDFNTPAPRIAVAGLNPHAGEGGAMGGEEIALIAPVLDRLRTEGLDISGPHSADTMYHGAARARYDVAVAMYHDQALIPIKTLDFSGGVNVTLGLPFIRTSPDHGTAFDISGLGRADATSMIAALRMARDMAAERKRS
jgi:4-hydroxythreonine-4-phosphate dehydrogenase